MDVALGVALLDEQFLLVAGQGPELPAVQRFAVPQMEEPAVLRAGNSGSVYFAVNGQTYGPAAPGAQVVKNVALSPEALTATYALADLSADPDLAAAVAVADAGAAAVAPLEPTE